MKPDYTVLPIPLLILCAVLAWMLYGCKTEAGDSADIYCGAPWPVNGVIDVTHCVHQDGMPMMITHPHVLPNDNSLPVVLKLHGYGGYPKACTDYRQNPPAGQIVIYNCSDPDNNTRSWWGPLGGTNDAGQRLALSINKAYELFGGSIDFYKGVTCVGVSQGGTGCIIQSMILPDGLWKWGMTVDAVVPHTLFSENNYGEQQQAAWGYYPASKFDVREQMAAGRLRHTRFRIQGHTNDSLGVLDTDFFRYCDQYLVECFGLWNTLGHNHNCGFNFDCNAHGRQRQAVIFTHSSGNQWDAAVGHYNLGLTSYRNETGVYVRYQKIADDQPEAITVNATVDGVTYQLALQSGEQPLRIE